MCAFETFRTTTSRATAVLVSRTTQALHSTCCAPLLPPRLKSTQVALCAGAGSEGAKGLLRANTTEAVALGAFGAPSLLVSGVPGLLPRGELFFGSDRFEQLAFLCGKPWRGPDPEGGAEGPPGGTPERPPVPRL